MSSKNLTYIIIGALLIFVLGVTNIVTGLIEACPVRFLTLAGVLILAIIAFVYRQALLKK